jgi:hypothetical protein
MSAALMSIVAGAVHRFPPFHGILRCALDDTFIGDGFGKQRCWCCASFSRYIVGSFAALWMTCRNAGLLQ